MFLGSKNEKDIISQFDIMHLFSADTKTFSKKPENMKKTVLKSCSKSAQIVLPFIPNLAQITFSVS